MDAWGELGVIAHFFEEEFAGDAGVGHKRVQLFLGGGDLLFIGRLGGSVVHLGGVFLQVVKLNSLGVGETDQLVAFGADAPMFWGTVVVSVKN